MILAPELGGAVLEIAEPLQIVLQGHRNPPVPNLPKLLNSRTYAADLL